MKSIFLIIEPIKKKEIKFMAKNANHVSHKKSKQIIDGKPKLPLASDLVEGEIAINFGKDVETMSIKNESGDVVTFSSDNYYTEKKLGSGFTGENSGVTVTEALENVEIAVDQVIDSGTSASTNAVATKAVYDAITDNELVWSKAYTELSGIVSSHTENTEIHVTAADKEKLHTHNNKASLDSITGNVGTMAYENKTSYSSATEVNTAFGNKANTTDLANFFDGAKYEDSGNTKVINFYHGNIIKATIDANDFIVDGMVEDVRIENGYLVVDFNTASGKQDIQIPLTDIFDPSNYYNKTAIDNLVGSGFTSSSITDVIIENEEIISSALNDLEERKLDSSAYTPTDLSNYYTKSETSGKTEISTALDLKVNNATYTSHTADTSLHFSGNEKRNLDALATNIAAISGITATKVSNWDGAANNSHSHANKTALDSITGNVGTMAYQDTTSYSSATQVNTALSNKVDKVSGKGLSTNDYTTDEKNKLSGIASGAQVNVIETVKVNGTALTPSSKAVNVTVPTKTSDLTNDSNFVSDASYVHTDNNYTTTEKNKLAGIAAGAEVNQNAFSNIKVGSTTIAADSKTDTLEISGSGIVTITADATNDKITISASNAVTSVAGKTGAVTLVKGDVGLGNVDNTADANKTVKAATSAATADTAKAVALSGVTNAEDLKAIEALTGTSGLLKKTAANTWTLDTNSYSTTAVAVTGATYNSTSKKIELKNAAGTVVSSVDATAFIKDGMVSNVEVKNVTSSGTCLVITFNTDAGKDAINIPISQIFDANNYYTKADLTGSSTTVVVAKAASATTAASAGSVALSNVTGADDLKAIEALTGTSGLLKKTAANTWALDTTSYSSATQVNTALASKASTGITITAASGLTGGGNLSANRTIGLASTGTSGTYGPTADVTGTEGTTIKIPQITTDAYGRVTAVTERTLTNKNSTYTVNNGTFTVSGNGASVASTSANASANTGINIKAGSNVTITTGTSEITIAASQPTVNNGTLNLQANGTTKTSFTANQSATSTFNITSGSTNGTIAVGGTDVAVKGLGSMAYTNTSSYSSATQVNTALAGKSNTGHTHDGTYAKSTFSRVTVGSTNIDADTTGDTLTLSGSNVTLTPDATNDKLTIGITKSNVTTALGYTPPTTDTNYYATGLTVATATTTNTLTISGTNSAVKGSGVISAATTTAAGLMSADDKTKLNGIAAGAEVNVQSDWNATSGDALILNKPTIPAAVAVKGNAETSYRTGNVNITPANIGLGNVGNFKAVSTVASQGLSDTEKTNARANIGAGTSSFSGSYNDLSNKPTIPTVNNGKFSIKGAGTEVASTTANASSASSVDIVAGSNVTVIPDATNKKITIAATDTTYGVVSASANGLAPKVTDTSKFLKGDGTWATPTDTNNRRSFYGTCDTAADTAAKAITLSDTSGWELKAGTIVGIKFTNTNSASNVTLNVNSSGAKSIWYNNAAYTGSANTVCGCASRVNYYMYDGTYWVWLNMGTLDGNTDNKVAQTVTTTSADYEVLFSNTADNTTRTEGARKNSNLKFNPSTGNLQATQLNGVTIGSSPKFTDTTYSAMSVSEGTTGTKTTARTVTAANLKGIIDARGYTTNTGTVTSVAVKMNGATKGTVTTSGTINLGTVLTSHQDISGKADKTTTVNGHALSSNVTVTKSDVGLGNVTNDSQVKRAEMGTADGVATLDSNGKVPSSQLPSYVDDVIEGYFYNSKFYKESAHTTEITGETGKIYVDLSTNKTYRWGGSAYVVISETLALGETSSTAYRGDRGKTAYTHSQTTSGNPHNVTKSDVGLGNVGNFKAVSTVASQGLSDTEKANARANIGAGTSSFSGNYNDLSNKPTIPAAAANGTYTVKTLVGSTTTNVSDFTANQSSADDITFVQGTNVTITPDATNRKITIASTNTKVTSVGNHYTPTATSANTKSATASSTSELNWGSAVVTGVTLSGDAKGHITSVTVASGKLKTPVTAITPSNSGSTDPIATKVVAENELVVSSALNNKVDKTEYATFSAATNTSIEDLSGQSETVAAALNELNNRISQLEEQLKNLNNN